MMQRWTVLYHGFIEDDEGKWVDFKDAVKAYCEGVRRGAGLEHRQIKSDHVSTKMVQRIECLESKVQRIGDGVDRHLWKHINDRKG